MTQGTTSERRMRARYTVRSREIVGCENRPMAMNPTAWLEARGSGYEALSREERDAVAHFAFLWSLFESVALGRRGSAAGLVRVATEWQVAGLLLEDSFGAALRHFQSRYYSNGAFTQHFGHLNLRGHDRPGLVARAIRGEAVNVTQTTAAVLTSCGASCSSGGLWRRASWRVSMGLAYRKNVLTAYLRMYIHPF